MVSTEDPETVLSHVRLKPASAVRPLEFALRVGAPCVNADAWLYHSFFVLALSRVHPTYCKNKERVIGGAPTSDASAMATLGRLCFRKSDGGDAQAPLSRTFVLQPAGRRGGSRTWAATGGEHAIYGAPNMVLPYIRARMHGKHCVRCTIHCLLISQSTRCIAMTPIVTASGL